MFKKLEYVYAVYKEKSFTAAAEKLYVSQPCLSAAIKKTEQLIGAPLFERRTGDLTPTKIGFEYLACAEKILAIEQSFTDMLEEINRMKTGNIRVGGSNYVCSYILPVIVSDFSNLYPGIEISITEASSVELEKMLRNDKIDVVIDSYDVVDEHLDYHPLSSEKILLAVPTACNHSVETSLPVVHAEDIYYGHVKSSDIPNVDLSCFQNEKFILLKSGNSMYKHAQAAFDACAFVPHISFRLDQLSTSFRLAASGNGLCFVTDTMFKTHLYHEDVVFYNVKGAGSRTLYAVSKRSNYPAVVTKKFIEVAEHVMQQLPAFHKS